MQIRSALTAVALVALGAVLAPAAGHAAGTLMTLVDSDSATQAQVDGDGRLRVGDGTGPITVDGTVTTQSGNWVTTLHEASVTPTTRGLVTGTHTGTGQYRRLRINVFSQCTSTSATCDAANLVVESIGGSKSNVIAYATLATVNLPAVAPSSRSAGKTILVDLPGTVVRIGVQRVNANTSAHPTVRYAVYGDPVA